MPTGVLFCFLLSEIILNRHCEENYFDEAISNSDYCEYRLLRINSRNDVS